MEGQCSRRTSVGLPSASPKHTAGRRERRHPTTASRRSVVDVHAARAACLAGQVGLADLREASRTLARDAHAPPAVEAVCTGRTSTQHPATTTELIVSL